MKTIKIHSDEKKEFEELLKWFDEHGVRYEIIEDQQVKNLAKNGGSHWTTCPVGCCDDSINTGEVYF